MTELTLQDHHDIGQLFARYGRLVDGGNADGYVALFTEDGSFARTNAILPGQGSGLPPAAFEGRAALHKLVLDLAGQFRGKMRHQLTDVHIEAGDRPGEARGTCYALITDWREGAGKLSMHGTYHVSIVRTSDGWRFKDIRLDRLPT
jgi:ketosteroid isomerase-like protein